MMKVIIFVALFILSISPVFSVGNFASRSDSINVVINKTQDEMEVGFSSTEPIPNGKGFVTTEIKDGKIKLQETLNIENYQTVEIEESFYIWWAVYSNGNIRLKLKRNEFNANDFIAQDYTATIGSENEVRVFPAGNDLLVKGYVINESGFEKISVKISNLYRFNSNVDYTSEITLTVESV